MKSSWHINRLEAATDLPGRPLHLAIGMFDGVHLGHRAVIEAAVSSARRSRGLAGVLTFSPHPSSLFRPEDPVRLLQTPGLKTRQLVTLGVDLVITQAFDAAFASITAADFVPHLRHHLPGLVALYVGENWRFGRGRRGDIQFLNTAGAAAGLAVFSAARINHTGEPISSTRIRGLLAGGELETVNALLGYAHVSEGVVTTGRQLGRALGFPTLNLPWNDALVAPRLGVYAVRVGEPDGERFPAVANFGLRPTVEIAALAPRLEVHVLGDGTGARAAAEWGPDAALQVEWLKFLREEQRFHGVEALRAQVEIDRAQTRDFFLR